VDGFLLLDKPKGLTSNSVLQKVKHLYHAKKAGHTGTLDPLATGMLPLCFGEATKFSQYVLEADKSYEVTGLLGTKTDTADALGNVISQVDSFAVSQDHLMRVLPEFTGSQLQTPSMYSALKHQGKPLYHYARAGVEVPRKVRNITIHSLELLGFDGKNFTLRVHCSKGTYIRNLVEDIGEKLGVFAHVVELRRLYTAGFANFPMVSLEILTAMSPEERYKYLLPVDTAVLHLPHYTLTKEQTTSLRYGQEINLNSTSPVEGLVRVYQQENDFIGLAEITTTGVLIAKRLLSRLH
jgi:tRNA pseudouridine55 synthase